VCECVRVSACVCQYGRARERDSERAGEYLCVRMCGCRSHRENRELVDCSFEHGEAAQRGDGGGKVAFGVVECLDVVADVAHLFHAR